MEISNHTDEGIRVLLVSTNQLGVAHMKMGEEFNEIRKSVKMGSHRDLFHIYPQPATTLFLLQTALEEYKPHIVHFSGHGEMGEGILLEDERGSVRRLGPEDLTNLLMRLDTNIRLVFMNVCHTKNHADAVRQAFDYAIGMDGTIEDDSALSLSASFYYGLASGRSIIDAFGTARSVAGPAAMDAPTLKCRTGVNFKESFLAQQGFGGPKRNNGFKSDPTDLHGQTVIDPGIRGRNKFDTKAGLIPTEPVPDIEQVSKPSKHRRVLPILSVLIILITGVLAFLYWRPIRSTADKGNGNDPVAARNQDGNNNPTDPPKTNEGKQTPTGSDRRSQPPDTRDPKRGDNIQNDRPNGSGQHSASGSKPDVPRPEKANPPSSKSQDNHQIVVSITEIADGQTINNGAIERQVVQKLVEGNFKVVPGGRSPGGGVKITGRISTTPMDPFEGMYFAKANGMLQAVNTLDGKIIASANISDIRGFGLNQKQASEKALTNAADEVVESFVRRIASAVR